jgi:hypothetical protein
MGTEGYSKRKNGFIIRHPYILVETESIDSLWKNRGDNHGYSCPHSKTIFLEFFHPTITPCLCILGFPSNNPN